MRGSILAIDQGTSSSRALVVDGGGQVAGTGQKEFRQHYPRPGWVEHDPEEIWASTQEAVAGALADAGIAPVEVAAIGIANQRETVVLWERSTGCPVANAIVWQDRRSASLCDELRQAGHEESVSGLTGLTLDPYFSATKLAWMLREDPGLRRRAEAGELAAGTVDSWLVWKLTGGARHVTDYTNASRTMLFNIRRGRWDERLGDLFQVPRALLPQAHPSRSDFGTTSNEAFGAAVPILGIAGDQQAALYGQACFSPGQAKNTYGTGCFLLVNSGAQATRSQNRLLTSLSAGATTRRPEYVLEGSVFVAGAAVQWLRDELGIIGSAGEVEALAASVPDSGGVEVVPAFTGLGAPYWDARARGTILGLTRGTTRAHLARATLEAIALSSAELLLAMESDLGRPVTELRADGGAARNDLLMQMQADFSGVPVIRTEQTETTALGAAYLAGLGAFAWSGPEDVASLWKAERRFEPRLEPPARHERLHRWRRAVERTFGWADL